MNAPWDARTITDDTYRTKFTSLPDIIRDWTMATGTFADKDILDFGCGEATTALGIALNNPTSRVIGIDIMPDVDKCRPLALQQLGLPDLPPNLHLHRVRPGKLHNDSDRFDVIYSWSVFEHVEQRILPGTLTMLKNRLKPGGQLFIQISPLYFSEDGSHLMQWVPESWGHLLNQHNVYMEKLKDGCPTPELFASLKSMFETLNRLTADELVDHARAAGFAVKREFRTDREAVIPDRLLGIYRREVLLNEQIVLLLEPA